MNILHGFFAGRVVVPCFVLLAASTPLSGKVRAPDSLTLSPPTFSNTYVGTLDLTITGLDSAGQTVVVEEFFDGDDSSTINAGDLLLRKFSVTDGQVTTIGGQRNLNIPGDEDGAANSAILTRLPYSASELFGRLDGRHIFRVSPSGAGFTPFTASLMVTQQDYAGSGVSGTISGGMPAVAQPGAAVVLRTAGADGNAVAATIAGAGGNYSLKAAPGNYGLIVAKSGFVFDTATGPSITVPSGSFATGQNVALTTSGRTISGIVRDGVSLAGVPALPIIGQSQTGFFSFSFSDGSGNYVLDATTDPWGLGFIERDVARSGLLPIESSESSPGSVSGFNLDLPRATSLIYGTLRTPANVAVPFAELQGNTNGAPEYKSAAVSDANGNYTIGVIPTSWRVNLEEPNSRAREEVVVVNTNGSAVLQNLTVYPITARLRGVVRDQQNNLVPFLEIHATHFDNMCSGCSGISSYGGSDDNGAFDLGVFGGGGAVTRAWELQITSNDNTQQFIGTSPVFDVQDGVNINGITYLVYAVTAHLRGQVLDENDAPIANVNIYANSGLNGELNSGTNTDGGGNFDLGVFAGTWNLGLSNIDGLGLIPQNFSTTVSDGVDQNGLIFRARHTTATISGTVMSASSVPISGVTVSSTSTVGGANYVTSATTDGSGNYSLPVFSTTWSVGVDSSGLIARGYSPVGNQSVFVNTGTVTVNFVAAPIATAVSRKLHGGTPFDINLPLSGTSGVECRSGGASNDYQIVVTFGSSVTFTNAAVSSGTGSVSSSSGSGSASVTVNLTGVTTAQRLTVMLTGVNNGSSTFDLSIPMGVLVGDTNGNGAVTGSDISQTKAQSGMAVGAGNFRTDVNASGGNIGSSDISLVKSRSGNTLPP